MARAKKTATEEAPAAKKPARTKKAAVAEGAVAVPEQGPLGQIFGVRHLSPMGAWHLQRFIEKVNPTAILIEGPSDANEMLVHLAHKDSRPPLALLSFTKDRPVRSIMYPLAAYSPEWIALREGHKRECLVRFMDLPASAFLAMHEAPEKEAAPEEGKEALVTPAVSEETRAYLDDPYEAIAVLSGDPDHDTWWERFFEHNMEEDTYREAIFAFGKELRALRTDAPQREKENLVREAYMRRIIRQTIAQGHDPQRIVIVCGAFHASVLTAEEPAMTDKEHKALAMRECVTTIMPYSYYRLSAQSGYGAGNHAPGYFQALWEEAKKSSLDRLGSRVLSEVAGSLRRDDNIRSSAEVIEAVRLARSLAALHGDATQPTLRDLQDGAITCLGQGDGRVLAKHFQEIAVGSAVGKVPPGVARTSLQEDFYHHVDALGLEKYLQDKKVNIKGKAADGALDLREDRRASTPDAALRDRRRSIFFHRLELLQIPFVAQGTIEENRPRKRPRRGSLHTQNTFKEYWHARWTPDCEIALAENSLRGDSIEVATVRRFGELLGEARDVGAAATLVHTAVLCDLRDAVDAALQRIQVLGVDDAAFNSIAEGLDALADTVNYNDVRDFDVEVLRPLVPQLFLRATLLAESACHCDDDAARGSLQDEKPGVADALGRVHRVATLPLWDGPLEALKPRWDAALELVADDDSCNPLLSGVACALLLERGLLTDEALEQRVGRRVLPGMDPMAVSGFFEGLASRNRMVLFSRKKLWEALDAFLQALTDEEFRQAVPGLRRAFRRFEQGEARRVVDVLSELWGGGREQLSEAVETKIDDQEAAELQSSLEGLEDLDL